MIVRRASATADKGFPAAQADAGFSDLPSIALFTDGTV